MSIYKSRNERFFVQFNHEGRTYKKTLPQGATKREAEKFEAAWKSNLFFSKHNLEEKKDIVFEEFLTEFYLPYSEAKKASFERDLVVCQVALKFFKGKNLRAIKQAHIEEFKQARMRTPTQHNTPRLPATVEREVSVVSSVFTLALKNDFVEYNPCRRVDKLKFDNTCYRKLKESDEQSFFAAFESEWARDVCLLVLNTALRQKDALGLQRKHLHWDEQEIVLVQSKTQRTVTIPMNQTVQKLLRKWLENNEGDFVFPSPKTGAKGLRSKKPSKARAAARKFRASPSGICGARRRPD